MFSKTTITLTLAATASLVTAFPNPIYIMRNAETPSLGLEGLTPIGHQRASECLPTVFGPSSGINVGLVIACTPDLNTSACTSSVDTATPLVSAISLPLDTSCGIPDLNNSSETCVLDKVRSFAATAPSGKAIVIVWDIDYIDDLFDQFDLENDGPDYPESGGADVIFEIRNNNFVSQSSMGCPGIDGAYGSSSSASLAGPSAMGMKGAGVSSQQSSLGGESSSSTNSTSAGLDGVSSEDSNTSGVDGTAQNSSSSVPSGSSKPVSATSSPVVASASAPSAPSSTVSAAPTAATTLAVQNLISNTESEALDDAIINLRGEPKRKRMTRKRRAAMGLQSHSQMKMRRQVVRRAL